MVIGAVKILGIQFATVDVLYSNGKYLIRDINPRVPPEVFDSEDFIEMKNIYKKAIQNMFDNSYARIAVIFSQSLTNLVFDS